MSLSRDALPILDADTLVKLRQLQRSSREDDFFGSLVDLYLKETPPRIAVLCDAHNAGEAKVVSREAHAIAGSCGSLGALRMRAIAAAIEERGASDGALQALNAEFAQVREALLTQRDRR